MFPRRTRAALFTTTTAVATVAVATLTVGSSTASSTSSAPAAPTIATTSTAGAPVAATAPKGVTFKGAVGDRGAISRTDLADFPQRAVKMTYTTSGGDQTHRYTGPLLLDLVKSVEPNFSSDKHDPLRYVLLVQATDGFLAAVAWGEIDPELANKRAILALTEDGKQLKRPRLVLPGDSHGARQVYDVAAISLLRLSPNMAGGNAGRILTGVPGHEHH